MLHANIRSLIDVLKIQARQKPDETAYCYLIDGENLEEKITYAELDRRARMFAAALQKSAAPGERALLLYPSGLEFVIAFFGCLYAGVIAAPATVPHMKRSTPRLQLMMDDAATHVACTTRRVHEKIAPLYESDGTFGEVSWFINEDAGENAPGGWQEPPLAANDIAFLQYTSGSTSAPKGVMISHFNLIRTIEDIVIGADLNKANALVSWLPIFHDMGLIYALLSSLYAGIPCYIMSPVAFLEKPIRWLAAISKYRATHTAAPNFAYDICVKKISEEEKAPLDLSSLKSALNAAEPVRLQTMKNFAAAFEQCGFKYQAFTPGYGLAEATVKVSTKKHGEMPAYCALDANEIEKNKLVFVDESHPNAYFNVGCGWSNIGADIQIVNPQTGLIAPKDEMGEIWVKSDSVAQGYWNNPQASAETFHARIAGHDGGPYLRTGDMGFIHNGELYIAGRIKDMIIIQGRNYYPQDIELTVETSDPALRPSCGAAFAVDDGTHEHLIIVQEVKREHRKSENLKNVVNNIRMAVAKGHGLRASAVALIAPSTIEKTTSGKIQRHAAKDSFLHNSLDVLYEWRIPDLLKLDKYAST